jgi:hypothetical protein
MIIDIESDQQTNSWLQFVWTSPLYTDCGGVSQQLAVS